jgi:hypothetical protein
MASRISVIHYDTFLAVVLIIAGSVNAASIVTFDDLSLANESYWSGTYPSDGMGGTYGHETFQSGGVTFNNYSDSDWNAWHGWAYSNTTNTTTGNWTNQYSAVTGGGINNSSNYGVCYDARNTSGFYSWPTLDLQGTGVSVLGAYFTNTTYSALAMKNGSSFNKKFGGGSSNDPDWFKLTIIGIDNSGTETGTIDFYLADFTFADNKNDYIINQWTWLDLSTLGIVKTLQFSLSSSDDSGGFGINNPAYFAMDNLTIPEPATFVLLTLGGLFLCKRGTKKL